MTENILGRLFEHNNWANLQIIQACSALSDEQLDAEPPVSHEREHSPNLVASREFAAWLPVTPDSAS